MAVMTKFLAAIVVTTGTADGADAVSKSNL